MNTTDRLALIEHLARIIGAYASARDDFQANAGQQRARLFKGRGAADSAEQLAAQMQAQLNHAFEQAREHGIEDWEIERFVAVLNAEREMLATTIARMTAPLPVARR